ncbi:CheR family methyltransferase [Aquabacter cavernae]|uniref:CheR family methyltransferase n=1 Tax=Aquabacter cavernae TaxID=2496029 RepID=UPI000F8D52B4|nr:CheR family methyltransferase [Aquabacter cavernae]
MTEEDDHLALEAIEVDLFIEAMLRRYGYDFRDYGRTSLTRRVRNLAQQFGTGTISALTALVLHSPERIGEVIGGLSVPASDFFRDPAIFRALKAHVFPVLASYARITIWQAGCARGEEVYSLAILLKEAGLYEKSRIFATDISETSLASAQEGIFPLSDMRDASRRYFESGGTQSLSAHYHARYERAKLDRGLIDNVTFAEHNLVTDGVFCEAHLILCRNVMIYFNDRLQARVLNLFADTLVRGGFLCVGDRENLRVAGASLFRPVEGAPSVFRLRSPVEPP